MAKVYEFLADGFEEIEALAPADILRRGGVEVTLVSIMPTHDVVSAHNVTVKADALFSEVKLSDADLLVLPGGMPGAQHLLEHEALGEALLKHNAEGKRIAAICAAPMVLGKLGILSGKRATCYPGFEGFFDGAEYTAELVTVCGNVTTGRGPGAAMAFGYQLLSYFTTAEAVEELKKGMIY